MEQSDQELDRLNALLHALPVEHMPMTLSELDGYLAGVLACPDMIPPSEWMPHVWGETGDICLDQGLTSAHSLFSKIRMLARIRSLRMIATRASLASFPWLRKAL